MGVVRRRLVCRQRVSRSSRVARAAALAKQIRSCFISDHPPLDPRADLWSRPLPAPRNVCGRAARFESRACSSA